ncbi:hypothetical protein [Duganella sp.]|uniref:hypothetical protein n=1 Tax=Duganella sp. TaxID=1904440 RepID=UPI0031E04488
MATQVKTESTSDQILERLGALEIDVAVIKSNYATREDIAKLEVRLIRWFVATAVTLTGMVAAIAFSVARFIH